MANNKAVTKKTSKTQMKFASPEVLAAYNKAAEGGFEAAEVADLKAAEAKTTEVAKAAFAEALAKKADKAANKRERDWPKKASLTADLKAGAILAKDSLGEVIPEQAVVIAERVAGKVKGKKAPKAPVTPAEAKKAVEAVVAKIVTEKAASSATATRSSA
jgi:hypothetical protein